MADNDRELTVLLQQAADGVDDAFEEVAARVYSDLERIAGRQMRVRFGGRAYLTLEPAAVVNETLLRILRQPHAFANRRHFFAFANRVMIRVLLDYQRARRAEKRGGDYARVTLSGVAESEVGADIEAVGAALEQLEKLDQRKAEVVKLRIFWGLSMAEIGELMEVSEKTVQRDWRFAKSWIGAQLRAAETEA